MRIFALLIAAAIAVLVPAVPVAAEPEDSGEDRPLTVRGITPLFAEPDTTLTVSGTVTNTTGDDLDGVRVRLRYSTHPLENREQLAAHAEGERGAPSLFGPDWEAEDVLEPGESINYRITVEIDDLSLGGFGVYPVVFDAVEAGGEQFGFLPTFLPYIAEDSEPEPTRVAWLWPLVDRPHRADDDTFLSEDLSTRVSLAGRLGVILSNAPEDLPVTWAVDPGLLADVQRLATDDAQVVLDSSQTPGPSGPELTPLEPSIAAQLWLDDARGKLSEGEVVITPYADADLAGLLAADLDSDAEAAIAEGRRTYAAVVGQEADTSAVWPSQGRVGTAATDLLVAQEARTLILDESAFPPSHEPGHAPHAAVELTEEGDSEEPVTAVVADAGITEALGEDSHDQAEAATALQRFVAETAILGAAQPDSPGTLLAAPPPYWNPGEGFARDVVDAGEELPWLETTSLEDLTSEAVPLAEAGRYDARGEITSGPVVEGEHLEALLAIRDDVRLFNSILTEGEDPFREAVLRMESLAWRDRETPAAHTMNRLDMAVSQAAGDVRILPAEPITMASRTGEVPILVANDLPYTVSVTLAVHSDNSERLAVEDYTERMEIAPGGRTTVHVPLSATVNGLTVLNLSLHNEEGEPLDTEAQTLPVTVTGLGSTALILAGVAAGALLVMLVPRAARKWRRVRTSAIESTPTPTKEPGGDEHHER